MTRLLGVLVGLVAVILCWLVFPSSAGALAPAHPHATYTYDAPVYDAPGNDSLQKRGPPGVAVAHSTYDVVDDWSRGTSARSNVLTAPAMGTYGYLGTPAESVGHTTTTAQPAQLADGDLSSLQRFGVAAKTERRVVNGETTATKYGREMHATWDYGPGFQREFRLPSGRRVDGINLQTRQIVELKPNNPRAIRLGERQLDDYLTELNDAYPGSTPWTGSIQTYTRP